uniref:hypothetical protein n=1 Tax=Enterobacter ludwigii TaxID=299767 RepID=UPI0019542446
HLFMMAAALRREAALSDAFPSYGVAALAPKLPGVAEIVNTHPLETFTDEFFESLHGLLALPGSPQLVVEVHESAVVEVERM